MELEEIQKQMASLEDVGTKLTEQLSEMKEKAVGAEDFEEKFKEMNEKIEANQKAMDLIQEEKTKAEQIKRIEILEASQKTINEKLEVTKPRIEVPTHGLREGNMTIEQKGWEALIKGWAGLKEGVAYTTQLGKDLNTSQSTTGSEWVMTGVVPGLIDVVRLHANVAGQLNNVVLSNTSDDVLVQTSDASVYIQSEATSDNASALTGSQLATNKKNLASVRLGAVTWLSDQFQEDSVIDIINAVQTSMGRGMGLALDDVIINGDDSGAHQDSDSDTAGDARKAWKGLRYYGLNTASLNTNLNDTTPDADDYITVQNLLGKYGAENLLWIVGPKGRNDAVACTWNTTNSNSSNFVVIGADGALRINGFPVAVTEKSRENLNASGVYDGTTTTKRTIMCVRKDRWLVGIRKNLTIELDRRPFQAQTAVVGSIRAAFGPIVTPHATTEPSISLGYNI